MNQRLLNQPQLSGLAILLLCLLALLPQKGHAQLYYLLTDGSATTTLDELRRTPLSAASETTLTNNLVDSPGTLAVDLANNRILVANVRNNLPRIAAISLTAPYTVTTFLTPAPINGTGHFYLGRYCYRQHKRLPVLLADRWVSNNDVGRTATYPPECRFGNDADQ